MQIPLGKKKLHRYEEKESICSLKVIAVQQLKDIQRYNLWINLFVGSSSQPFMNAQTRSLVCAKHWRSVIPLHTAHPTAVTTVLFGYFGISGMEQRKPMDALTLYESVLCHASFSYSGWFVTEIGIEVPFRFVGLEGVPCVHPALRCLHPREQSPVLSDSVPLSFASLGTPDPSEWEIRSVWSIWSHSTSLS